MPARQTFSAVDAGAVLSPDEAPSHRLRGSGRTCDSDALTTAGGDLLIAPCLVNRAV